MQVSTVVRGREADADAANQADVPKPDWLHDRVMSLLIAAGASLIA